MSEGFSFSVAFEEFEIPPGTVHRVEMYCDSGFRLVRWVSGAAALDDCFSRYRVVRVDSYSRGFSVTSDVGVSAKDYFGVPSARGG